jgi:hypothetical protein
MLALTPAPVWVNSLASTPDCAKLDGKEELPGIDWACALLTDKANASARHIKHSKKR